MLALLLVAGGRGPAAAAALPLGLPAAPVDHSADHLEPSTASALELALEHTEIASGLVVEPAHAPASKAVHKVVLLDAEHLPPLDKVMEHSPRASQSLPWQGHDTGTEILLAHLGRWEG